MGVPAGGTASGAWCSTTQKGKIKETITVIKQNVQLLQKVVVVVAIQ